MTAGIYADLLLSNYFLTFSKSQQVICVLLSWCHTMHRAALRPSVTPPRLRWLGARYNFFTIYAGPKISQNVNCTQRGTMEGPNGPNEARRRGVPRGVGSGEERRSPSPENFVLTVQICSFFPRFQDRDSISVRDLHCILLLYITHSSKVNCTLDKVNWTLSVRKHTILGPGFTIYQLY